MLTFEEKIDLILTNHLPHIEADMKALKVEIEWIKWFMGAVILGLVFIILKK